MSYLSFEGMNCCGLREACMDEHYDGNFDDVLKNMLYAGEVLDYYNSRLQLMAGAVIFSQAGGRSTYVKRFLAEITKRGLGEVVKLPVFTNPNTKRRITPFIWYPNRKAIEDYVKKNNLAKAERDTYDLVW